MKKVAILQSNYIPWKGYFDIIASVDEFIILDTVQYTKNDWRNRNKIKTPNSLIWLTVPVLTKGRHNQLIKDVEIANDSWVYKHWNSLEHNYKKSRYFKEVSEWLKPIYFNKNYRLLSELNQVFIKEISRYLNINTRIIDSERFQTSTDKSQRLIDILLEVNAKIYLSGPAAMSYIDQEKFCLNGLKVDWMNYSNYPIYDQRWDPFHHNVSILDLIFNCGFKSRKYMKYANKLYN